MVPLFRQYLNMVRAMFDAPEYNPLLLKRLQDGLVVGGVVQSVVRCVMCVVFVYSPQLQQQPSVILGLRRHPREGQHPHLRYI